jgi:hypothetical protein
MPDVVTSRVIVLALLQQQGRQQHKGHKAFNTVLQHN